MSDFQEENLLSRQEYGILFPYIANERIKRIFYNGNSLWIEEEGRDKYASKDVPSDEAVERIGVLASRRSGGQFNPYNPVFEWENSEMSLQMLHRSMTTGGTVMMITKKKITRPDARGLVDRGYCTGEQIEFMKNAVKEGRSMLIAGAADSEKEEILRFLTRYINPEMRMLSIESGRGLYVSKVNPDKDVTEIKCTDAGRVREIAERICPEWIFASVSNGTGLLEMIDIMSVTSSNMLMCVNSSGDEKNFVSGLFPWVDERKIKGYENTIKKEFTVWITVSRKGIEAIYSADDKVVPKQVGNSKGA